VNSKIFPGVIPQTPVKRGRERDWKGGKGRLGKGRRVGLGEGKGWEGEGREEEGSGKEGKGEEIARDRGLRIGIKGGEDVPGLVSTSACERSGPINE
jgi:hypothetical protein